MLPFVRPTLAAIAIFTFLATWNEFMMSLIYLADQRLYPLSFGLYAFQAGLPPRHSQRDGHGDGRVAPHDAAGDLDFPFRTALFPARLRSPG
jgi:hypothetical protein